MTNLPDEVVGNTVRSSRWNVLLDKIQDGQDSDVRMRGRYWTGGSFVGSYASFAAVASGSKPYYGIRAEDFITSGDGTAANPYNASAIESAINAIPTRDGGGGGIVFIKAGNWQGAKILLGGVGQAGRNKKIMIYGEGAALGSNVNDSFWGTTVKCGFEITSSRCDVSFYDMRLEPDPSAGNVPTLKYIRNGADQGFGQVDLGGYEIQNCRFQGGNPAIWNTGINIPSHPDPVQQTWMVRIQRCHFQNGGVGIKVDEGDSVTSSSYDLVIIDQIDMNARGADYATRAVDIVINNVGAVTFSNWLIEGAGTAAVDYGIYIKIGRAESGFSMWNIFTGDGAIAAKDARIEVSFSGLQARGLFFTKTVDLFGYGDYEIGQPFWTVAPINITAGGVDPGGITLRQMEGTRQTIGTITNPRKVLIKKAVGNYVGLIGSAAAGASPYTYTNDDSYIEDVYLVGGTITDVQRNGTTLGSSARQHTLSPGQSIVITHAGAPTIVRYGIS